MRHHDEDLQTTTLGRWVEFWERPLPTVHESEPCNVNIKILKPDLLECFKLALSIKTNDAQIYTAIICLNIDRSDDYILNHTTHIWLNCRCWVMLEWFLFQSTEILCSTLDMQRWEKATPEDPTLVTHLPNCIMQNWKLPETQLMCVIQTRRL